MRFVTHAVLLVMTLAVLADKGRPTSHVKSRDHRFRRNTVQGKTGHKSSVTVRRTMRELLNSMKRMARIRRQLMTAPPKSVKVEVKFKQDWLEKMADKLSSQYKLMDGNIVDAIATELIGDSDFLDSRVMTLKKSDDGKPRVLSDIDFNFITEEQDPVKHLRAIVAQGRISGLRVYPDYFVVLKDREFLFDLKLKQDWYPFLSDQSSSPFKTLSDEIKKTIKQLFADDPYFIDSDVIGFTKDKDGHTHARILLKFHPGENDPEKRLKDMILAGKLGKIPVFDDYFNGQLPKPSSDKIITPPAPPPMAVPPTQESSTVAATPPVPVLPTPVTSAPQMSPPPPPALVQQIISQQLVKPPTTAAFTSPQPTTPPVSTTPAVQSKSLDGEVKLQMEWYPFLADHNSFAFKSIANTIAKAIQKAYAPTAITVDVNGLSKDPNGKLIASFNIRFPPRLAATLAPLQAALSKGFLGGLPIFSSSQNITTTLAPLQAALSKGFLGGLPIFSSSQNITTPLVGIVPIGSPLASNAAPSNATSAPQPTTVAPAITVPDAPVTIPPVTIPPVTIPPVTIAPVTIAPVTIAPVTKAPVTVAPVTMAPVTVPPVTVPPVTVPPVTVPPVTMAPVTVPPVTVPPVTMAPVTVPPVAMAPATSPPASHPASRVQPIPTQASTPPANATDKLAPVPLSDAPNYPYNDGLIPLPDGMPQSCADIRSSGIGTMDGEYVIQAKQGCHLNIICQNMDDPLPKEYLGGPQQRVWLYWHYAVLIKLSDYDKKHIDDRACLEKTAVGREFINKVMLAGARQGNPLIPFKTNIKRMINKFIGKAKKRRSLENDMTISTRATRIYKKYAF